MWRAANWATLEHARQVNRDDFAPLVTGDVEEIVTNADACVIDEDIYPTHRGNSLGKSFAYLVELCNVRCDYSRKIWQIQLDLFAALRIAVKDHDF